MRASSSLALIACVVIALSSRADADVPAQSADDDAAQSCQVINSAESFDAFLGAHNTALIQIHSGREQLAVEFAEALSRTANDDDDDQFGYAVMDGSAPTNAAQLAKLERDPTAPAQYFVFRNGLLHTKVHRLEKAKTADDVEEV